ncbi:phosphatase PAP2 family protein [Nostoc sp. CMAA1605]|uniref:phosphatase PAP2 family protein n=1 Tax=Nostoc sp. CMAA1605 TaxID=2055159 RepID=UPI001F2E2615|nr:phosphatase PAP2 family protein [Nostoc sp. CMAA1605]MCF4968946.1 phosphoesterase [Nostoc sp. CMAA1605]
MNGYFSHHSHEQDLIQAIHTSVKGRGRFKVKGLHQSEFLAKHIELCLIKAENIVQVRANHLTGNVLVIFHPDCSHSAIASLLQDVVLDYSKATKTLPLTTVTAPIQPQLNELNNQLIVGSAAATTLILSSGIIYQYGLDEGILLGLQKLHNPLLDAIIKGVTFLGEPTFFLAICSALGINLWQNQRPRKATTLGLATVGAVGLNLLFKEIFRRARPTLWNYIVNAVHYSFPSGHAMVSTAVYGCIGYILAKEFPQWRKQILTSTTVLILAIGFSRLYLGVHWPTDVLAGYAAGLLWLIVCILYLEWEQKSSFAGNFQQI